MILRKPVIEDTQFVFECYGDWPLTTKVGTITIDKVTLWIRRWISRSDETCLIGEENGKPVGLILYRISEDGEEGIVDNIVVHPDERQKGYHDLIAQLAWEKESANGVKVARFNAVQGPITDKILQEKLLGTGKYHNMGEIQGETGTLVKGEFRGNQ